MAKKKPKRKPQVSKVKKKKSISHKTYGKVKRQRNLYLFLIPTFMFVAIFGSIMFMKNANVVFTTDLGISSDNPTSIELIYEHGGQIRTLQLSDVAQKIPKSSDLLYFRALRNETAINTTIIDDYQVFKNFTFEVSQNVSSNIEYDLGLNFKNESSQWYVFNRLHKQKIFEFSFNRSYQEVKNMSISFEFKTNYTSGDLLNDFDVEFYNFQREIFQIDIWDESDLTGGELTIINATIDFPCVYLNRTYETNTTFKVLFHAMEKLTDQEKDFDFNISNVIVSGNFWKEVNISSPSYIFSSLEYNRSIEISNTIEIKANEYIFTSLVILNETISFGSWIESKLSIWNSTSILREDIQLFNIENENLAIDSYLGLRECIITINSVDFDDHTIDYTIKYGGISF